MTMETEISTPVDETVVETSVDVEPEQNSETSTAEPETVDVTAETQTQSNENDILYAGKYKSVEELEKGYSEAQKFISKASEFEKKYNELLEKQEKEAERIAQEKLQQAQYRGFNSVEQQEIADKVQLAEFEYYVHNLSTINPEYVQTVQQYLQQYYESGNKVFLDEAKRYFSSEFVEKVAIAKNDLEYKLNQEYENTKRSKADEQASQLAQTLQADFAEFLQDIETNEGKAKALKAFCDFGSITSKEDMQIFHDIYSQIAKHEREQAIKEYEASKVIDETKHKAVISSNNNSLTVPDGLKETYTAQEIGAMSQQEYNALCDKYGEQEITKRIV